MPHPDFAKAVAHLTEDHVREVLMDLVDIASPTGHESGVAHYLAERMRRSGLDVDLPLVDQGRPNAVGHWRGRGDGLNLLFTGHMDTSYSGEEEHLAGDGFKPKAILRDGWVLGLGANNMKSGLASALVAIEAIVKAGCRLAGDVSFGAARSVAALCLFGGHRITHGNADKPRPPNRHRLDHDHAECKDHCGNAVADQLHRIRFWPSVRV